LSYLFQSSADCIVETGVDESPWWWDSGGHS
jgi:hypothetical protein